MRDPILLASLLVPTTAWANPPFKGGHTGDSAKDMIELSIDLNGTGMGGQPDPKEWGRWAWQALASSGLGMPARRERQWPKQWDFAV